MEGLSLLWGLTLQLRVILVRLRVGDTLAATSGGGAGVGVGG